MLRFLDMTSLPPLCHFFNKEYKNDESKCWTLAALKYFSAMGICLCLCAHIYMRTCMTEREERFWCKGSGCTCCSILATSYSFWVSKCRKCILLLRLTIVKKIACETESGSLPTSLFKGFDIMAQWHWVLMSSRL